MFSEYCKIPEAYFAVVLGTSNPSEIALDPANVKNLSIIYDINNLCIEGSIVFNDTQKIMDFIPPDNRILLKMFCKDYFGVSIIKYFKITKVVKDLNGQSVTTVGFEFVDEYYFNIVNTFISKGYKNTNIKNIILDVNREISNKLIYPVNVNFLGETKDEYEEYIINGSKSILNFFNHISKYDNLIFINSRQGVSILSTDDISNFAPDLSGSIKFTSTKLYNDSPLFVRNLELNYQESLKTHTLLPKCISYQCDDKFISTKEHSIEDSAKINNIGSKIITKTENAIIGNKLTPLQHNVVDSIYNFESLLINSIKITVAGSFAYNLLQKVSFELNSSIESTKSYQLYVCGKYFITKIVDNIQSGNIFTQTITLSRSGVE